MRKIRIVFFASAIAFAAGALFAQTAPASSSGTNQVPEFDHTTVYVRDVAKSVEFYGKVLGLERIPDPFKDDKHVWFRAGAHSQLHIVGGATQATPHEIEVHCAFRVTSLDEFRAKLDRLGVAYRNLNGGGKMSVRTDGVHQIYFQDPDGYWIEVNDDKF